MLGYKFGYFLLLLLTILKSSSVHASDDFSEILGDEVHAGYGDDPDIQPRIVGGVQAPRVYSFMAQILNTRSARFCAGSLISRYYVLTTAHCCRPRDISKYQIHYDIKFRARGKGNTVSTMIIYPQSSTYYPREMDDLCIIRLSKPSSVYYTTFERFRLDDGTFSAEGRNATVIGFGSMNAVPANRPVAGNIPNGTFPLRGSRWLMEATVPIASSDICQKKYGMYNIDDKVLCAGYVDGRRPNGTRVGTCLGDFGSPLLVKDGDSYVQIGLSSFGNGCGATFDGYARISTFKDWIMGVISECDAYIDAHGGSTCALPNSTSRVASMSMSVTVSVLSTSLMLMITAFFPFALFWG